MTSDPGHHRAGTRLPYLPLVALLLVIFGSSIGYDFVLWDDPVNVTQNPLITEPWSKDLLARLFTGEMALRFKPLPWLISRATHALWGFNPAAWHAVSLLLHVGATLILAGLFQKWLADRTPTISPPEAAWIACGAAALWAVHPARVEPAVWVTAMPYPLMGAFLFASFHCYTLAQTTGRAEARKWYGLSWCFALGGHLSYPVGVTYVLWLLAADRWIFRTAPATKPFSREQISWLLRHAAFALPAVLSLVVTWQSAAAASPLYPAAPGLDEVGLLARIKMAAAMLTAVWTHFAWPFGHTPNNPMIAPGQIDGLPITFWAVVTCLMLAGAWLVRCRWPAATGLVIGVAGLCVPVLGLTQWPSWSVADRHVYLPHAIFTGTLAVLFARRISKTAIATRPILVVAAAALVVGVAWRGHVQASIWRDTDTLFAYIEKQPAFAWDARQQAHIYSIWAAYDQSRGRTESEALHITRAQRALVDRMVFALQAGDHGQFIECSRDLEQRFGLPPQLRRERAKLLLGQGQAAAALRDLEVVARALPEDPETQDMLRSLQQTP